MGVASLLLPRGARRQKSGPKAWWQSLYSFGLLASSDSCFYFKIPSKAPPELSYNLVY